MDGIKTTLPGSYGKIVFIRLELSDLRSVKGSAEESFAGDGNFISTSTLPALDNQNQAPTHNKVTTSNSESMV